MIARGSIYPEGVVVISTTDKMVLLREKVKVGVSRDLLLMAAAYDTARNTTILPFKKTKETEMEIRTQRMVIMPKKDGEGEPRKMNPDFSAGLYVTKSVDDE